MRQLAYALPDLPGLDSLKPKTYAGSVGKVQQNLPRRKVMVCG
jgi:hypothetical protein